MKKIGFGGIGPKTAIISGLYFGFVLFITKKYANIFVLTTADLKIFAYALLIIGLFIYFVSIFQVGFAFKSKKLAKTWFYLIFRNPVYASFILFIVPGLALYFNSWLILTVSVLAYILFARSIKKEYEYLAQTFGQEYKEYLNKVWCKCL
jgi:protein-S-isoprenylcysteine O-methyltransferase Ste14